MWEFNLALLEKWCWSILVDVIQNMWQLKLNL